MGNTLGDISRLEQFSEAYFTWMCKWLDPECEYSLLLRCLYEREFTWIVDRDVNRAEDGCILRTRFEAESGMPCDAEWIDWPCSVLEMMLALSIRVDDQIMYDISSGERVSDWFWEMATWMDLTNLYDEAWRKRPQHCMNIANERIDKMLDREYSDDGKGGLMPCMEDISEWRTAEIWVQANRYFGSK